LYTTPTFTIPALDRAVERIEVLESMIDLLMSCVAEPERSIKKQLDLDRARNAWESYKSKHD
jgi:hypothetical protein